MPVVRMGAVGYSTLPSQTGLALQSFSLFDLGTLYLEALRFSAKFGQYLHKVNFR